MIQLGCTCNSSGSPLPLLSSSWTCLCRTLFLTTLTTYLGLVEALTSTRLYTNGLTAYIISIIHLIPTMHRYFDQQIPAVVNWRCWLTQADLYNGRKKVIVLLLWLVGLFVRWVSALHDFILVAAHYKSGLCVFMSRHQTASVTLWLVTLLACWTVLHHSLCRP